MKKRRMWTLVAGLTLAMGACDSSDDDSESGTMDEETMGMEGSTGMVEPPPETCLPGGDASLELGNGENGYLDSDSLELVYGPQGGYHVVLGLRARNLDTSNDMTLHLTGTVGGQVLGTEDPSVAMTCNSTSQALETSGILLIWDPGVEPAALENMTATIEAELTDAAGTVVTASHDFMITPP